MLHEAGRLSGAAAIVTRDASGFSSVALRVYAPDTLVAALDAAVQAWPDLLRDLLLKNPRRHPELENTP